MKIWMRSETRANETRAPLTPSGAAQMRAAGWQIVVEDAPERCISTKEYRDAGCEIAPPGSWPQAPDDTIILGLKELPENYTPLRHRHIMFGHAYKGQSAGAVLLKRFAAGGGTLLDLEYLLDTTGRRVAAFGYWAGYAGAALSVMAWGAAQNGEQLGPVDVFSSSDEMAKTALRSLGETKPSALIIGALGRVGNGASDLCARVGITPTKWDMDETAHGGPFPEILAHNIFLNCILAQEGVPNFIPKNTGTLARKLAVIGDIACDPDSPFNPVPIYSAATTWNAPVHRVHPSPVLDVMAIDNLPSLLPRESTEDFGSQLLPHLLELEGDSMNVWARATNIYAKHKYPRA